MPTRVDQLWNSLLFLCACLILIANSFAAESRTLSNFGPNRGGSLPFGGLVERKGSLYGTARDGGANDRGTVFKLSPANGAFTKTVIYNFRGDEDGSSPMAGVTFDSVGNLYGTTQGGGAYGSGTVYRLSLQNGRWSKTTLYNFKGAPDGDTPQTGLIFDEQANLYGTTYYGGTNNNAGTVFKLTPSGDQWTETVIHSFDTFTDGYHPDDLVLDVDGSLLGFTCFSGPSNHGTIYRLTNTGGTWTFTLLYDFGAPDDGYQIQGRPVLDGSGGLYGSSRYGGTLDRGTLFRFDVSTGLETVLHNFTGEEEDGQYPAGILLLGRDGNIYGTTLIGGTGGNGDIGYGTLYEYLSSSNTYQVVYSFRGSDGRFPVGALIQDGQGNSYGTASAGGVQDLGTAFQIRP